MRIQIVLLVLFASVALRQTPPAREAVLIRTPKPYAHMVAEIQRLGGSVTRQFKYVDAIAAEIPTASMPQLGRVIVPGAIEPDTLIPTPKVSQPEHRLASLVSRLGAARVDGTVLAASTRPVGIADLPGLAQVQPSAYLINNALMRVSPLHAAGHTGAGVVVAVIDTGIRPGFP